MIPNVSVHTINGTPFPPISQYVIATLGKTALGEPQQFIGADAQTNDTVKILTRPHEFITEIVPSAEKQENYSDNDMIICGPRILAPNDLKPLQAWLTDCKKSKHYFR